MIEWRPLGLRGLPKMPIVVVLLFALIGLGWRYIRLEERAHNREVRQRADSAAMNQFVKKQTLEMLTKRFPNMSDEERRRVFPELFR